MTMAERRATGAGGEGGTWIPVRGEGDLLGHIGNTPLVRLRTFGGPRVELWGKLEGFNPGGSVKDRPALEMVEDALARGLLRPGMRILDATSGNTGIGLAMVGAALGFGVTLALPANASSDRKRILRAYGAELVLTDPLESTDGAQRTARELAAAKPELYCYVDQYNNPANLRAHYRSTGPEIWRQTHGRVTHLVAGLGTTGTVMGAGRYLRERNPRTRLIGVQPEEPLHGVEGLKHMATAKVPGIFDPSLLDQQLFVATGEAQAHARNLARREGLLVGTSSGAALAAALRVAKDLDEAVVVVIFPDAGDKYLGDRHWGVGS